MLKRNEVSQSVTGLGTVCQNGRFHLTGLADAQTLSTGSQERSCTAGSVTTNLLSFTVAKTKVVELEHVGANGHNLSVQLCGSRQRRCSRQEHHMLC